MRILHKILGITGILFVLFYLYSSVYEIYDSNTDWWLQGLNYVTLSIECLALIISFQILSQLGEAFLPYEKSFTFKSKLETYPFISIFIPIFNVSPKILDYTLIKLGEQNYPKEAFEVYVGDDSSNHQLAEECKAICQKHEVTYVYDSSNKGYKAGMMNILLKKSQSDLVAVFDVDHSPLPQTLSYFVQAFQKYPEYDFVQAKNRFRNVSNFITIWSALMYAQYFQVLVRSKTKANTVLFNGSSTCFRRDVLMTLGGFPTETFTEDADLTFLFAIHGKKGYFLDYFASYGLVPETFDHQISQLWRWAHGGTSVLLLRAKQLFKAKIKMNQKVDLSSNMGLFTLTISAYVYALLLLPIYLANSTPLRLELGGFPAVLLMPIGVAFIYAYNALLAIYFGRKDGQEELKYRHLLIFIVLALAANPYSIGAVWYALIKKRGPSDPKSSWNPPIRVRLWGFVFFIIGLTGIAFFIPVLIGGKTWVLIFILLGLTLVPAFPISLIYKKKVV
ncbi:MAG: glycosyltransferase [Candidatus Kariarchaeaceae archaeon]